MTRYFLLPLFMLLFSLSCSAQDEGEGKPDYLAGTHYDVIDRPVPKAVARGKLEVAEFFWYGCSHCFTFEPLVKRWKQDLPADVEFRGIPAIWRNIMELHARAYFTAEALGVLDTMHGKLFQAMNVDHKRLGSQAEIAQIFVDNGVPRETFDSTFNSFGVSNQVTQAMSAVKSSGMTGTPSMMVEGKYLITAAKAGSQADMLKVAAFLLDRERTARDQ